MMKAVVLDGTGKRAELNGYTTAGKTGTAWKFDAKSKSVDSSKYVSSFIGMAPADNPRVVVLVVMDEPKVGARDGGVVSAPVYREIAQQLLEGMNVPKDGPAKVDATVAQTIAPPAVQAAKPKTEGKSDAAKPAAKAKPTELKKTTDPRIEAKGKTTAAATRRDFDEAIERKRRYAT
jgi:cell division protein FtsI (penicillin-binding protein 3)